MFHLFPPTGRTLSSLASLRLIYARIDRYRENQRGRHLGEWHVWSKTLEEIKEHDHDTYTCVFQLRCKRKDYLISKRRHFARTRRYAFDRAALAVSCRPIRARLYFELHLLHVSVTRWALQATLTSLAPRWRWHQAGLRSPGLVPPSVELSQQAVGPPGQLVCFIRALLELPDGKAVARDQVDPGTPICPSPSCGTDRSAISAEYRRSRTVCVCRVRDISGGNIDKTVRGTR